MSYNVTIKTIPQRYAATVHMTIPRYDCEGMIWSVMMQETAGMRLTEADPCLCAVTFWMGNTRKRMWRCWRGKRSRALIRIRSM